MIAIADYGMGNLRSVSKAFEACGARVKVTSSPKDILKASKIVLPGVGAFASAVSELRERRLIEPIIEKIAKGTPYLGICLGLQLLFEKSEEKSGHTMPKGFGIVKGQVRRFAPGQKVPHMGWNQIDICKKKCPLFKGISSKDFFYFVHSYYVLPGDVSDSASETYYGKNFCSAIWKDNLYATQFHPEKSQVAGLQVIRNFIRHCS